MHWVVLFHLNYFIRHKKEIKSVTIRKRSRDQPNWVVTNMGDQFFLGTQLLCSQHNLVYYSLLHSLCDYPITPLHYMATFPSPT
jgi:hypothetical protein